VGLLDWLGLTIVKTKDFDSLVAQLKKAQDDNFALKQKQNLAEPKKLGLITLKEIHTLLSPLCQTFISDENFNTTSKEEAMKFTEETKVQNDKWVAENHDCDNFSFALMGYWSQGLYSFPLGIAWSGLHAFNIMVDDDKQIWIIEPQTNKWMTLEEAKVNPMYFPLRVIMI
jgi:hypothetical protein